MNILFDRTDEILSRFELQDEATPPTSNIGAYMSILFDDSDEILSDLGLQDEPTPLEKMASTNLDDLLKNHEKIILKESRIRDFVEKETGCEMSRIGNSSSKMSSLVISHVMRERAKTVIPSSKLYKDLTYLQSLDNFLLTTEFSMENNGDIIDSYEDDKNVVWRFMAAPAFQLKIFFTHITKNGYFSKNQNQSYMHKFESLIYCEADFVKCLKDLRDAYKAEADRLSPDLMLEEYL